MTIKEKILKAVRAVMPPNSEIRIGQEDNCAFNLAVSWKLNDDPEQPNKISRPISICVSREAAQDYASASAARQDAVHQRVVAFLSAKLEDFDPMHDVSRYEIPPVTRWVISSGVIPD